MICPKCASENPQDAAFCGGCGIALTVDRRLPERDAHLPAQAERRRLTVMFCDLVGSTALSGQLDPEELHDLTRQYQRVCAAVIGRHGGQVAQYLGDGLLVFFGYPIAHEDDALRAVRAGLDIVAAIAGLSARLAKPLQIRVAVHTGLAVVGRLGDGTNPNAMAIVGETPNIAARLQILADPGTVIISAPTYRLVEGFFHCRSLGAPPLKGVAAPIELHCVLAESGIQSRFERAVATGLTPFVGREAEAELMLRRWHQARDGNGQVVLLSGEAGIGKTRLMREAKERTTGEPMTELALRCSAYYQDSSLYPVISFLQRFLRFEGSEPADARLQTLERVLEHFGFPLDEYLPLFAALLSLPFDHRYPAPPATAPQRQKQKTFEAITAWLLKLAQERPTWVVVEDVHWADPSTLELLNLLIDQVSRSRLLVVVIFRTEFVPPWRYQPNVTSISLGRLPRAAAEMIIDRVAGRRLPPEVTAEIALKTEGVPLFVEELTRMVLESGMLRKQGDHYTLTRPLMSLTIPSTLYESLMARLDRLGAAKEVAQIAATIGKEFSYELLAAVSPLDEARLTGALNRLVEAELLDQYLIPPQTTYSFKHAMIRDAAYESLLRSKRRQYHGKIAEVLQQRFPGVADAQPELLATHYTEAGLIEQAVPFWQRAGQRALERSANQEAIRHLTKGVELLRSLPEGAQQLEQEILFQTTLGTALIATKGFASPEVERAYIRAKSLCERAGGVHPLLPVALFGLWVFYTASAEHVAARGLGDQCLSLAMAAQDPALLLEAHHALGVTLLNFGEFAAGLDHLEHGFAIYDHARHAALAFVYGQNSGMVCLSHAAWALWFLGYPDEALKRNERALVLAQKVAHPYSSVTAADFAAWLFQICRYPEAVEQQADAAIALSTEHDFGFYGPMGVVLRGWALTRRGQAQDGIRQMREGMSAFRATSAEIMLPYFFAMLAEAYGDAGQPEDGLGMLAEAQAAVDSTGERWWEAEIRRLKGELTLKLPVPAGTSESEDLAEECFRQALTIARAQGAKSLVLRTTMSLSRLRDRQGRREEAHRALAEIYASFTEGFDTPDLKDAKMLLEQLS